MAKQTMLYLCLLCIVLAHFTVAYAQGRSSSRQSVGSDERSVEVETANNGSGVSSRAHAVGQKSASATATSVVRSDGNKTTSSGSGSAQSDGDSVGLAITTETGAPRTPEAQSPDPVAPSPVDETPVTSLAPALAPEPELPEEALQPIESDPHAPELLAPAHKPDGAEIVIFTPYGVTKTNSSELAELIERLINGKNREEQEEQEEEDEELQEVEEKEGGKKQLKEEAPICWGEAAYRCCDVQDFVTNKKGTFCGCSESYKRWGVGYCRFKMISDNPTVWKNLTGYSTKSGRLCQCPDTRPRLCSGVTKAECCDNYDGQSDKCRCIYSGSEREKCFWKKSQDNPLIWEDNLFIKGRKCLCPGS